MARLPSGPSEDLGRGSFRARPGGSPPPSFSISGGSLPALPPSPGPGAEEAAAAAVRPRRWVSALSARIGFLPEI